MTSKKKRKKALIVTIVMITHQINMKKRKMIMILLNNSSNKTMMMLLVSIMGREIIRCYRSRSSLHRQNNNNNKDQILCKAITIGQSRLSRKIFKLKSIRLLQRERSTRISSRTLNLKDFQSRHKFKGKRLLIIKMMKMTRWKKRKNRRNRNIMRNRMMMRKRKKSHIKCRSHEMILKLHNFNKINKT